MKSLSIYETEQTQKQLDKNRKKISFYSKTINYEGFDGDTEHTKKHHDKG